MTEDVSRKLDELDFHIAALEFALVQVATIALSSAINPVDFGRRMTAAAAGPDPATVPSEQRRDALARRHAAALLKLAVDTVEQSERQ